MAAGDIVPVPGTQFEETLASASPDVSRAMIREFAQRMMDADVEVACNAGYGEVTPCGVQSGCFSAGFGGREQFVGESAMISTCPPRASMDARMHC